jgi:nucleoside-diphosphate-sugar epimerase
MVGQVAQVGTGKPTTLLELVHLLAQVLGRQVQPAFGPGRAGDIRHSCANLDRIHALLGYQPTVGLAEGLRETLDWMKDSAKGS